MLTSHFCKIATCLLAASLAARPVLATWSIIIVDSATREVGIGSATCILSEDLEDGVPVVLVGIGAGAAQSAGDVTGENRLIIWNEMLAGVDPGGILDDLQHPGSMHQTRQYGIVDAYNRAITFSGTQNGAYASGRTGTIGTMTYSIQGNVLTGAPVLDAAVDAVINTPGGMPEKLMAGMEAAASKGGDGRCSCSFRNPTGCGSPPPSFTKAAHIGFVIVARRGDVDGDCSAGGCAEGVYYMNLNVPNQPVEAPDPVVQLRGLFDTWRASLVGVPDAIESTASVAPGKALSGSGAELALHIELRDWQGNPATAGQQVTVTHDDGSAGATAIGPVSDLGGGVYEASLSVGETHGLDRFLIQSADGQHFVSLMPSPRVLIQDAAADLNHDGVIDLSDLGILLSNFGGSGDGDLDRDGDVDLTDLGEILSANFVPGF